MIFISPFEIISVIIREARFKRWPDPNIFLSIAASVADATAVNPNDFKTLLANGLSTFPIKGNPVFENGPKSLPKNTSDWEWSFWCLILCNWVLDNFLLAHGPFAKVLQSPDICVLVNDNLCGKLVLSLESPTTFDENFKATSVLFFDSRL